MKSITGSGCPIGPKGAGCHWGCKMQGNAASALAFPVASHQQNVMVTTGLGQSSMYLASDWICHIPESLKEVSYCKLHSCYGKPTTEWEPTLEQVGTAQEPAGGTNGTTWWGRGYRIYHHGFASRSISLLLLPHSCWSPGIGKLLFASIHLSPRTTDKNVHLVFKSDISLFFLYFHVFFVPLLLPSFVKYTLVYHLIFFSCIVPYIYSDFHINCSGDYKSHLNL